MPSAQAATEPAPEPRHHGDQFIAMARVVEQHDRVRSPGDHPSGGNDDGGSRCDLQAGNNGGSNHLIQDRQLAGFFFHRPVGIIRPHRVAIVVGAVKGGDVHAGRDVL